MSVNEIPMIASPIPRVRRTGGREFVSVDYVPAADGIAGTVIPFGSKVGIVNSDMHVGQLALAGLDITGVFDFPKVSATAFAWGDEVAWDAATTAADGEAGAVIAAGGTVHGIVCQPGGAEAGSATVRVVLV